MFKNQHNLSIGSKCLSGCVFSYYRVIVTRNVLKCNTIKFLYSVSTLAQSKKILLHINNRVRIGSLLDILLHEVDFDAH